MHLFDQRCIVITRHTARRILGMTTVKSAFGTVRHTRTSPSDGHPTADHGPFFAPISARGEPDNTICRSTAVSGRPSIKAVRTARTGEFVRS